MILIKIKFLIINFIKHTMLQKLYSVNEYNDIMNLYSKGIINKKTINKILIKIREQDKMISLLKAYGGVVNKRYL